MELRSVVLYNLKTQRISFAFNFVATQRKDMGGSAKMAKDELKGGHTRRFSMFANGALDAVWRS